MSELQFNTNLLLNFRNLIGKFTTALISQSDEQGIWELLLRDSRLKLGFNFVALDAIVISVGSVTQDLAPQGAIAGSGLRLLGCTLVASWPLRSRPLGCTLVASWPLRFSQENHERL